MFLSIIGFLLLSVFAFLGGLHYFWGFGGQWGKADAVPSSPEGKVMLKPGVMASLVVGSGLLGFGLVEACGAGLLSLPVPRIIVQIGLWAIVGIFLLRAIGEFNYVGFFKKVRNTSFGRKDTLYYSPLCLLLALLTGLVIALG